MSTDEIVPHGARPGPSPARYDDQTELTLKLWTVLHRAHTAIAELDRRSVESHGLSGREFSVLEVLYHKGPLLLGDVQRKVLSSSGGITYLVDRLAARGLVERRECETDRRASYAALTEAGSRRMEEIFPVHAERLSRALAGLDAEEKRVAIDLMRKAGLYAAGLADEGGVG